MIITHPSRALYLRDAGCERHQQRLRQMTVPLQAPCHTRRAIRERANCIRPQAHPCTIFVRKLKNNNTLNKYKYDGDKYNIDCTIADASECFCNYKLMFYKASNFNAKWSIMQAYAAANIIQNKHNLSFR